MSKLLLTMGPTSLGIGVFMALGMILLLLAPHKKAHRFLACWVFLVALGFVVQQIGLQLEATPNQPLILLHLARIYGAINLVGSVLSTFGVVYFLNRESRPAIKWLLATVTVWATINLALVTIRFDTEAWLQVATTLPVKSFNPFDFIGYTYSNEPVVRYTMYSIIALLAIINWTNVLLFWTSDVPITARIGSFTYVIATLTAIIPWLEPLLPFLVMAGGVLITHAVLTSNLFDPLRSTNVFLAEALANEQNIAHQLEQTLTEIEAQVAQRSHELRAALAREKELSLELERSLQQESELNQLKTQIISNVSHEFRTPLTIIKSSSDMLNRYRTRLDGSQLTRYKEEIQRQIVYLDELLRDLLFINRSNASGIVAQPVEFDGRSLYLQLCSRWERDFNDDIRLAFSCQGNMHRHGQLDINLLHQIGHNLISNAIKFSDGEAKINIHFQFDTQLTVEFSDNGIGIVPGEEGTIFGIFQRGSNVQSRRGLGLGLFTVSKMVDVLGGQISAQNRLSGGSVFRLQLPYRSTHDLQKPELA